MNTEILPGTELTQEEKVRVIQAYEKQLGPLMTNQFASEFQMVISGPPLTVAQIAEFTGRSEEWVEKQLNMTAKPPTFWGKVREAKAGWDAFWKTKLGRMIEMSVWLLILSLNMWIIGAGCERQEWQKKVVEKGYGAFDEHNKFKWSDNVGQNAGNGGDKTD